MAAKHSRRRRWQRGCSIDGMRTIHALLGLAVMTLLTGCSVSRPASTAAPPAALPAEAVAPTQRAIEYPHGRWILYGDGTTASPYGWVWVPTGATPPPRR